MCISFHGSTTRWIARTALNSFPPWTFAQAAGKYLLTKKIPHWSRLPATHSILFFRVEMPRCRFIYSFHTSHKLTITLPLRRHPSKLCIKLRIFALSNLNSLTNSFWVPFELQCTERETLSGFGFPSDKQDCLANLCLGIVVKRVSPINYVVELLQTPPDERTQLNDTLYALHMRRFYCHVEDNPGTRAARERPGTSVQIGLRLSPKSANCPLLSVPLPEPAQHPVSIWFQVTR